MIVSLEFPSSERVCIMGSTLAGMYRIAAAISKAQVRARLSTLR